MEKLKGKESGMKEFRANRDSNIADMKWAYEWQAEQLTDHFREEQQNVDISNPQIIK